MTLPKKVSAPRRREERQVEIDRATDFSKE
jgi:hypothetical protein